MVQVPGGGGATPSEADYGILSGDDYHYNAARAPTDVGFDTGTIEAASVIAEEENSALEHLKKTSQSKNEDFRNKIMIWQSSAPKPESYDVRTLSGA